MQHFQLLFLVSAIFFTTTAVSCPTAQLAWQSTTTMINKTSPGASDNKYGFEDGIVIRREDNSLLMIASEMYGDQKWVKMRLGVWRSSYLDPLNWERVRSLRVSDENFNGSSQHSSSWGPFFIYDSINDVWVLSYVGYRGAPSNGSGWLENFQGTIFAASAPIKGDAGLDTTFNDSSYVNSDSIILEPSDWHINGPWPHPCQGLQGTDSMYPYLLQNGTWAALVGTSHQESSNQWGNGKWPVSVATAPTLAGPWTRYNPTGGDPADAPCVNINGGYTENPVVSHRPDIASSYHAVYDNLSGENKGFGYVCSEDGISWESGSVVNTPGGCRTPFGLIPLDSNEIKQFTPLILSYGVINATQLNNVNSSLQWSFYTQNDQDGYESFVASITYLSW
jgi:hypothetical protein